MKINRNNYEEFFLLYADGELCATDRKAVDVFVVENADLKKELQLLLQTVSGADAVLFENKEALMKPSISELQQQLLLHIDNELTEPEKQITNHLIKIDAAAAKEFSLLQQTVLQPDADISFANKNILYRKAESNVVRITWWRAAAAAIVIGFISWGTYILLKPNALQQGMASTNKNTEPIKQNNIVVSDSIKQKTNVASITNPIVNTNKTEVKITPSSKKNKESVYVNDKQQQRIPEVITNNNIALQQTNNLPTPINNPHYNNFNNNPSNQITTTNVPSTEDATNNGNSGTPALIAALTKPTTIVNDGYAINTAYNTDEAEEENNNKVFYISEEKVKRSKLGGFIRKVKRVVQRNTSVKTGNSIKVAGFDIALN
jgi:hypothetical protein